MAEDYSDQERLKTTVPLESRSQVSTARPLRLQPAPGQLSFAWVTNQASTQDGLCRKESQASHVVSLQTML
jgi:hypothetical protein